jgi:hypothetical protein
MIISRIYCPTCRSDTVHKRLSCIHCGAEHVFTEELMNEVKFNRLLGQKRKARKGAAAKNARYL